MRSRGEHLLQTEPVGASSIDIQRAEALLKTGALQRAIVNSSNVSSIATDADGVIQIFNVGAEQMLGYTAAEVTSRLTPADLSDPEEIIARAAALSAEIGAPIAPGFEALIFKASRGIEDTFELTYIRKDGSRLPVVVSVTALRDAQDAIIGYLLIGMDNTARKQAAEMASLIERTRTLERHAATLRRSEDRTNYALSWARIGVWELDLATRRLTWSATLASVFGLKPEDAPDTTEAFLDLIHPNDRFVLEASLVQAERDSTGYEVEFRALLPDGSTRWVAGRARMVRDADNQPVRLLGVGTDISERKSLEAQFRQAQKMEAVGQLAGGVAHDFNNLLTVVLGFSNFVLETLGPHDPRCADMEEVVKAAQRATVLTKQLLAFSRKQILQPTAVNVSTLVTGMRPMLGRLIGEHVELVSNLAADLSPVRADPGQLEQVLMNLVVNARDAMPTGGRLTIETANVDVDGSTDDPQLAVRPGSYVLLSVRDTGTGMNEETRQRLFEPFFTTKEQGKGTGLGLATVYGIVKQSGGHVSVSSEPGSGTTFKVYLPRTEGRSEIEAVVAIAPSIAAGTETLLLVEDEAAVRLLTRTILERAGYRVFEAASAQQAEDLFAEHAGAFTLLVTDVIMPGASGPALFKRLEGQYPGLKVLYVSGYANDMIATQGQLKPGVEFLPKPFTAQALTQRIRKILDHPQVAGSGPRTRS